LAPRRPNAIAAGHLRAGALAWFLLQVRPRNTRRRAAAPGAGRRAVPRASVFQPSCRVDLVLEEGFTPEPRPCAPQRSMSRLRDVLPVRVDVRGRRVSEWSDDAATCDSACRPSCREFRFCRCVRARVLDHAHPSAKARFRRAAERTQQRLTPSLPGAALCMPRQRPREPDNEPCLSTWFRGSHAWRRPGQAHPNAMSSCHRRCRRQGVAPSRGRATHLRTATNTPW
jgi:hypothetical protein